MLDVCEKNSKEKTKLYKMEPGIEFVFTKCLP